jgi:hypothetical protein
MSSSENNWALDFCLYCDKQTNTEEPYCSQSCRMADLEKPGYTSTSFSAPPKVQRSTTGLSRSSTHFNLAPPVNFESYRHRRSSKPESSPPVSPKTGKSSNHLQQCQPRPTLQYRSTYDAHFNSSSSTRLNSSSSRSSLSSNTSTQSNPGLTQSDLTQLQDYANAFDHVRDFKRRITLG